MRKPTLKQAIAGTLRTWRKVLELAEKGKWKEADRVTREAQVTWRATIYGKMASGQ